MNAQPGDTSSRPLGEGPPNAGETRFRAVVDGFSDPILIVDAYHLIRYVNAEFLGVFGYSPADVIGRPLDELLGPDDRADLAAQLSHPRPAPGASHRFEHRLLRRDGTPEIVETSANALQDPSGHHTIILHIRVITERRRAEETLRASEERLRHLVENSHDLIQSVAPDGRFLFVNRAWLNTLGYDEADLPHLRLWDVVHPDSRAECERALAALARGEDVGVLRPTFVTRRGAAVDLEGVAAAQTEGGRPVAANTFFRDVTEQRQHARVQAARFAVTRILAESPELGVGMAEAVETIAVNLGWHAAELWLPDATGQELRWRAGWHLAGRPELEAFAEVSRHRVFAHGGMPGHVWVTGEVLWEEDAGASGVFRRGRLAELAGLRTVVAAPIVQGREAAGVMLFFSQASRPRDEPLAAVLADLGRQLGQFAARKRAEADLEAERASLARRVAERTADLSRVNGELARAVRAKDEFLANMSHELRTPLNTILALSEVLLEGLRGPLAAEQRASIRDIEASGRHLLSLISDILDLAKVEAGRLDFRLEPVSIADTCQASLMFVRELAHRKQLKLDFHLNDPPAMMDADSKHLKQMLVNLLSNAVKFTPAGGTVRLEVSVQAEAGKVLFAVHDSGIGISQADRGRLFQPFTQLDSGLRRQHEGTGLGLALVSRLAELHGGHVTVESEPGRGSCFTLSLPYYPPAALAHLRTAPEPTPGLLPAPAPDGPRQGRPRILMAEDNESNIQVIGDYLRSLGYDAVVARSGREALEQAASARPDLFLLDVQMPELDGLEVTRRLRAAPEFAATPILILSALAMPGDQERCLAAGASAYMAKPVSLRGLKEAVGRLLAQ